MDDPVDIPADWFWETGADHRLTYLSPQGEATFGRPAAELLGLTLDGLAAADDAAEWNPYREACTARHVFHGIVCPYSHPDGGRRWLRIGGEPRLSPDGAWLGYRGVGSAMADDTRANQARLIEQNRRFDAALENMSQGLCMFDPEQRLVVFNTRYCEIFGLPPGALRIGMTQREIIEVLFALGCYPAETTVEGLQASAQASIRAGGTLAVHRDLANGRFVSITHRPMAGGGWVATFEDVTQRKEDEARIAYLARYDTLTDLANRNASYEAACGLADTVRRQGGILASFALSLRRFKLINDTRGPPIGDSLLQGVAVRLRAMASGRDTVARIGGDEFLVLRIVEDEAEALTFGQSLMTGLQEPFTFGGESVSVGLSVGIALWDGCEPEIGIVLKNASMAMDHAKAEGAGSLRLFAAEMDERARERRILERDIDEALVQEQFEVHYQPVLDIASRGITGLEALVRWRHPIKGLIGPGVFIPVMEESGLIVLLGKWVLEQACRDAAGWPDDVSIAVNVSAMQLCQGDFAETVLSALAASALPPQRLELEITESVLIDDGEGGLATLHRLRRAGIRISMDDFGTGYSSISYLRQFPFDKIKIDQSFVRDAPRSADALAIVRAIIGLGQSLGIRTLAEGIETEEQLAVIRAEGCGEAQGFLFSAARPATEIDAMLSRPKGLTRAA